MNRAVISIAITLGVAILPLQVTAAERSALTYSAGHVHKQQHDWQRHREHRREAIPHRNSYNQLVIKTDHRAVKKRLAAQRLKYRRHHKKHFSNPREISIHYYGVDRSKYHHHRGRHSHSHQHDRDYLEWLAVMAMLDSIYSDRPH